MQIVKAILDYLKFRNILAWRTNSGISWQSYKGKQYPVHNAPKGTSDIIGIYKGRFLAIEVKRHGGYASAYQEAFLRDIQNRGGIAFIAYSIDDVDKELSAI